MPSETNLQVLLARRPDGAPKPDDFDVRNGPMPTPGAGQILVRNSFLSLHPYMRGLMKDDRKSCAPPYAIGEPVGGATVGGVGESRHADCKVGDLVVGPGGWQLFSAYDASETRKLPGQGNRLNCMVFPAADPGRCRRASRAVHSRYRRRPADLPSLGRRVRVGLRVGRFCRHNAKCARRTFAERLPELIAAPCAPHLPAR